MIPNKGISGIAEPTGAQILTIGRTRLPTRFALTKTRVMQSEYVVK